MIKKISFLLITILICGCSTPKKTILSDALDAIPVVTGSVVEPQAFEKGGTIGLGAFKAGTGAAADDETDKLSLMMLKGIKETLPEDNMHFTYLPEGSQKPDFYLDGYIDDYGREGKISGLKLRKDQAHLSIDGEVYLNDTGEKIFIFQSSVIINLKTQDPQTVAYQMGVAIVHFMKTLKVKESIL